MVPAAKPQGPSRRSRCRRREDGIAGQTPTAAPGLKVNAFATGLKHPRWIDVLPNGDVLVAEAIQVAGPVRSVFELRDGQATMRRAAALGVSANRITLLRDADGDGVAETREIFLEGLNQPFGMALVGDTFYVGNTDGVVAFPYAAGADRITAPGASSPPSSRAGIGRAACCRAPTAASSMPASARSATSPSSGMEVEEGRAAIYEIDLATGQSRIFADGLAQPGRPGVGADAPACCGPWSTSATASATRRRRTI